MRLEPSLNVTPEGSLADIPTGVPKSIQGTKEASRAEALASTRQFFAAVDRRNVSVPTGNQLTSIEVHERDNVEVLDVSTTTVATTTTSTTTPPITMDVELRGTSSPRISLPKGSASRPTVTATSRPRTWMQQLTEGQTNETRREDVSSSESNTSIVETLPEDIPDELGHEWRILHPFDLPGVRFPTDTMPPNQRRLTENDALVELIQTTEYLDDVPPWGQRDYRLYPPQYGDPFYRGRGRGRGRREWLQERQMDRPNGGFGRGYVKGNNTRAQQQAPTDRPQPARQEDEWSSPTNVERRDDMERHQTSQVPPPAVPPPTEERLFTNWSSEDSPRERVNQCNQSARSVESNRIVNQTEQSTRVSGDNEVLRYVLSDVTTTASTQIQISQVGARFIDRETNTSEVEIRPPREEVRIDIDHTHSGGVQVPSHSELSSPDTNIIESSLARLGIPDIMPQLDGPVSVSTRRRRPVPEVKRKTTMLRGGYPDESDSDSHDNRSRDGRRHSGRRHYQDKGGRPPDRENNQDRGYPRRGRPPDDRGPPDDGGPPDGGSPNDGGPQGNGRPPR